MKMNKKGYMLSIVTGSGLCNKIAGISGTFLLSIISNRRFYSIINIIYLVVGSVVALTKYFNIKIFNHNILGVVSSINVSLSFSFYSYCINPTDMIIKIVKSNKTSISISSIHDIVPAIVKTRKYYNTLKLLHFIKCSNSNNILNQILEVNYVLYKKYFPFHPRHETIGNNIIHVYKKKYTIGIHVRLNDKCLKDCIIDIKNISNICNLSKQLCTTNCFFLLSSFSNKFTKLFMNINNNSYSYNSTYNIKHSRHYNHFNQVDVDKIVLDIYLTSNCDAILVSGYSTFSLLILYKGYYKNYRKCIPKKYFFWNNGEIYDHLERFRKINKCKNIKF